MCVVCREFKMGGAIEDQQVSCLWQGDYLLSVSVSGYINYLDRSNPGCPHRILKVGWPSVLRGRAGWAPCAEGRGRLGPVC